MKPCPFCDSGDVHYDDDGMSIVCVSCGATGPEGDDERDAVELWNETADSTAAQVVVHEQESDTSPNGVSLTLQFGTEMLCVVDYCTPELAATLRGALMLMGGMRQAKESEVR